MTKRNLQVEVTEATADQTRMINIVITGTAEDFLLADLLTKRKAIHPITIALKQAAQEAVKAYLESAEEVVSGVKAEQKKETPAANDRTKKRVRKGSDELPEDGILQAGARAKTVNGPTTTNGFSGD
jgi:hypothetical protein